MSQLPATRYSPDPVVATSAGSSGNESETDLFQVPISRPSQRTQEARKAIAGENSPFGVSTEVQRDQQLQIGVYPKPLIIDPVLDHRQTFILLHGRGGNATEFGYNLLSTAVRSHRESDLSLPGDKPSPTSQLPLSQPKSLADKHTLREAFPHAKFVFPTAAPLRAKVYGRKPIFQWMDNWPLSHEYTKAQSSKATSEHRSLRDDTIQVPGLNASTKYVHDLLRAEIETVGVDNVILGGLSQGCACALMSLLTWDGPALPAVFGMCGWLPFARELNEAAADDSHDLEDDDLFDRDELSTEVDDTAAITEHTVSQRLVSELYNILERPEPSTTATFKTPVFMGHGTEDQTIPIEHGETATQLLAKIMQGSDHVKVDSKSDRDEESCTRVQWKAYQGLGHWYSSEMLGDIVHFINSNTRWN